MLTFAFGLLVGSVLSCVWTVFDRASRWVLHLARAFLLFALVHLVFSVGGLLLMAMEADPARALQLAPWAGAACAIVVLGIPVVRALARSRPPKPSTSTHLGAYRTAALDLRPIRILQPQVEAPTGFEEVMRALTFMLSVFGVFVALIVGCIGFAS